MRRSIVLSHPFQLFLCGKKSQSGNVFENDEFFWPSRSFSFQVRSINSRQLETKVSSPSPSKCYKKLLCNFHLFVVSQSGQKLLFKSSNLQNLHSFGVLARLGLLGAPLQGRLLASPTNIRLGWKISQQQTLQLITNIRKFRT